ncbi:4Fe-4S binding protein [Gallintestinimicrobium sp.]
MVCGRCKHACPTGAINSGFSIKENSGAKKHKWTKNK